MLNYCLWFLIKILYFKYFQTHFKRPFSSRILLHYSPFPIDFSPLFPLLPYLPTSLSISPNFSTPCNRIFLLTAGDSSTNNRCPGSERGVWRQSFQERVCYRNTWPCRRSITRWGRSAPSRRELWRNLGDNWASRNWRPSN